MRVSLVIRPQEVGGSPSSLEAVEIPAEDLQILKRLSPRMVRNSDIRAVEFRFAYSNGRTYALGTEASQVQVPVIIEPCRTARLISQNEWGMVAGLYDRGVHAQPQRHRRPTA